MTAVAKITNEVNFSDSAVSSTGQNEKQRDLYGSQTTGIHRLGKRKGLKSPRRKGK